MSESGSDPFNLGRFVEAQQSVYQQALAELRAGSKRSHWSWYILPQVKGLGSSPLSLRFAIESLAEARAYLEHPLLGSRLFECVTAINSHHGLSAEQMLGFIDARKLHSCLTLFIAASDGSASVLRDGLRKYFAGKPDVATLSILASHAASERNV